MVEQQDEIVAGANKEVLEQVERILHSEEFRSSEVLRRLLRFLADKMGCDEGDELKEYSVAIGGMGMPSANDPHHNSTIRIQAGRLRRKLDDYYRTEGQNDPIIVDLPKGRYKLQYEFRQVTTIAPPLVADPEPFLEVKEKEEPVIKDKPARNSLLIGILAGALLLVIIVGSIWMWHNKNRPVPTLDGFTPELQELWQPFLASKRPLIMAIEAPLFAQVRSGAGIYIRDRDVNDTKELPNSPAISAVHKAYKDLDVFPDRTFITFELARTSLLFTKLLGPHVENLSVARASDVTLQQMTDNNVLFIGITRFDFANQLQPMPIHPELVPVENGIRNLHPQAGEPEVFVNDYSWSPSYQGTVYALITHLPGPLGDNDTESFNCRKPAGFVAAVKAFTEPTDAKEIVNALKKTTGGRMPRYFQVLLKVQFKDDTPISTSLVLVRVLS